VDGIVLSPSAKGLTTGVISAHLADPAVAERQHDRAIVSLLLKRP
jgi:hypothetical protein